MDEWQYYDVSAVLEDIDAAQCFSDIKFEGIVEFLESKRDGKA
jgi:hypothetical protein